jgi:hypothetical protein
MLSACGSSFSGDDAGGNGDGSGSGGDGGTFPLPPANAKVDYQLGGAYPPPSGVGIVSRDRKTAPVDGLYNICYVNGFQSQAADESYWLDNYPDLVLRDGDGDVVRDTQWNEMLLDIRLAEKRQAIASIVGRWIGECEAAGYDAIELDRLDSYTLSQGLLLEQQAVYMMKLIADQAHARGLAISQKNAAELVPRRAELGTDFALTEECNRYNECDKYTAGYGDHVIVVEYRQQDFTAGCTNFPNLSIVLRDLNLVTPQNAAYVYDGC